MNRLQLLDVVVRLASSLTDDFSAQDVLDRLTESLAEILPVVGVRAVMADPDGQRYEVASPRHGGPWIEGDGPALTSRGVSVHGGPARSAALEVYATSPLGTSGPDLDSWRMLAEVVASYLSIAHRREGDVTSVAWLQQAAFHDSLTGLPNRRLLEDRLRQARERARRTGAAYGILFCDLDGFKMVNDRFGHLAGDRLLVEMARRLEEVVRPHDTVARASGDEFVILCEDLEGPRPAEDVGERVLEAVEIPFGVHGTGEGVRIGISIGIAVAGGDVRESSRQLLDRADAAMYRAKASRGSCVEVAAPAVVDVRVPARNPTSYSTAS